ncbi:MAG: hypothetical protein ACYSWX_14390, partial [Planctomycetota bacterium]
IPDECDIASGASIDCKSNGIPDECELETNDCNGNGIPDDCDIAAGTSLDCNRNGVPDECDIASGTSLDCNANGIPDECELDCNANGIPDDCDIANGTSTDCDLNGVPDECDPDCNMNGIPDACDIADGTSTDCNANGIPDECDLASRSGLDLDCNGVLDVCQGPLTFIGTPCAISVSAGESQFLELFAGSENSLNVAWVLGSTLGSEPGIPLGGGFNLPLNADDPYLTYTATIVNSPILDGSYGALDFEGTSTATFTPPNIPELVGLEVTHAYVVISVFGGGVNGTPYTLVSNPVTVTLAP